PQTETGRRKKKKKHKKYKRSGRAESACRGACFLLAKMAHSGEKFPNGKSLIKPCFFRPNALKFNEKNVDFALEIVIL
ncbi:hypothetical protein, partial [Enterococcus faecalis]|uniref:hypothetical protein n=1 Tax=Enterococcus faecalis TaxID=1351 RepID=UPI001AD620DC